MNDINKLVREVLQYNRPFGLYLHIPFCPGKCRYCDFYSIGYSKEDMEQYLNYLLTELELYSGFLNCKKIMTIYIGGGTPGLLKVNELEQLLEKIFQSFSYPVTGEITIEANPCSLDEEKIKGYRELGVNRISLGVQSFQERDLKLLGRKHNVKEASRTIEVIKKYFKNFNLDFIFAIPGQSLKKWLDTLKKAILFEPPHLSLYNLQIEQGTELEKLLVQGKINEVSEELDAEMYLMAIDFLKSKGYQQYEISNFSQVGYRSEHNQLYWKSRPYLGLGPSAHSFNGGYRFNNPSDLKLYSQKIKSQQLPLEETDPLTVEEQMAEYMFMGLRLLEGIVLAEFQERFGRDLIEVYSEEVNKLIDSGLLELNQNRIRLTEKGLLLANQVFLEFLPG